MDSYRSSEHARLHLRVSLQKERREIEDRLGRNASLQHRLDEITEELSRLDQEIRQPDAWIRRLPIAAPCRERWDGMAGDEKSRHCNRCDKKVYNFVGMARAEAAELLKKNEGEMCVRLRRRRDGTVVYGDCPKGVTAQRRTRLVAEGILGATAVGTAAVSLAGAFFEPAPIMMGSVAGPIESLGDPEAPLQPTRDTSRIDS